MKHIKEYKIFGSSIDGYYNQITVVYISKNISKDRFIDVDNRVVDFVNTNISSFIKDNNKRIRIFEDNSENSGVYANNSIYNLTINGFDYSLRRGICHPVSDIKWIRNLRIYALTDDYYIVQFTMSNTFMYFLCDQFDGLVKLLIDYKICDEPINESSIFKKEDYYKWMVYGDYDKMKESGSKKLEFDDKEKNILEDISDKKLYNYSISIDGKRINLDSIKGKSHKYSIEKYDDEWYIFIEHRHTRRYGDEEVPYKCDGFEGLLKCINDIMPDIGQTPNKIDESLSDCEYYSEIPVSKFSEYYSKYSKIDIQKYYKTISNQFSEEYTDMRISNKKIIINFKRWTFGIKRIDIFLIDDEYFIVDVFDRTIEAGDKSLLYKCDQIDGLIRLFNDLKTDYSIDESLSHQDTLVKKADELEYEKWIKDRKPDDFNKYDTLVVFEIIKNLDPYYFGPTIDKYPFGKSRESSFWLRNRINEFRNYFIDRTLNEIKAMSDFFFTNNSFDGIHIKHYNNHIHFDKYQDEWYDVIISSSQGDQINYICDSIDGLKEVINMVGGLKFESESDINESLNESETLVKKLTESEYYNFINTHNRDIQTEDDVEVYMNFLREIFEEKEIEPDQHFIENSKSWDVTINEYGEEDKVISTGHFYFDKFEDEWYLVERQVDGWSVIVDYWLIDTKEGFQQLKNDIFE